MHNELTGIYLDQSKDLVWMVDPKFHLIYANKSYFSFMKNVMGTEKKLNQSALTEAFGQEDMKNWQAYYNRALKGTHFEVEEHFYNKESDEIQYYQITFEPLIGEDNNIFGVSCRSKDVTEAVQKQSEATQLLNSSLDVFCCVNAQGDFLSVSDSSMRLWGYTPEELIGQNFRTFVLEDDLPRTNKISESIQKGEEVTSFYNRFRRKDGGIAYNLWSATWDDSTQLMYAVCRDVKEKIKQEEEILHSEQRFKALVQEGADMVVILDDEGNYNYASPTNATILGIPQEEFMGRNAFDNIHPDDTEQVLKGLHRVQTENKVVLAPFRFQNNKKEWRWLDTVLTNMTDNPAINGIVANSRDITNHIQEKQQLKLLESVITNTKDAVIITEAEPFDLPGPRILYVNEAFTEMTGYEAKEVIGKTPRILQGPNSNREDLAQLGRALRNWESHELTILNYKKNGEEFWINFKVSPVADEHGHYTHWIAIERDVTEQKVKEIENDLISSISDIFYENTNNDITECLGTLTKHITEFADFDFAEIWLPAMDAKSINRVTNYYKTSSGKSFYEQTKEYSSCKLGKGMPGYVWKHKKLEIWKNKEEEWLKGRNLASEKAGIQVTMGVPLKDKEKVIGVLLLGTENTMPNLSFYKQLLQKLEKTIGLELSRKKVEIELAQIFNFSPDIICVAGFDGYLKRINPAGLELLGYSLDEMLSRPTLSFIHQKDKGRTKEKQEGLYKGLELRNFENRYITKQGSVVWLSWTAVAAPEHGIVYSVAKNITEEKNLRELNRQVGVLAKIGSWEVNLVNEHVFWSEELHHLHGTDPKSFVPTVENAINFYREDFRPIVRANFENCIATKEPYEMEAVIVRTDNKEIWVRSTGNVELVDGVCTRVYGGFQEINDSKLAALQLEKSLKSLEDYKFSLDQSAIIAFTDKKGVITSVNDNFCAISKYPREEIIGKTHQLINSQYHPKEFFIDLWKTIASGNVWRGEVKNKTKTGSYYWVDTTIVPFLGKKGKPVQYLAIRFDITERKKAEEEKYSLQRTLENSLNEIYTFDSETFQFSYANKGALLNLGYSLKEIKELTPIHIKPKFTKDSFKEHVRPLVDNEKDKIIFFTTHKRKNGTQYPVEVHLQLVKEANEKRFLAIVQDISEQKKMTVKLNKLNKELKRHTLELERSNEELEQFAFIASHDLQEPLRMISSFMDLLKRKYGNRLDEKGHQYIHFATDGAMRMKQIILDLLEYSRTNRPAEGKEDVNLNEVLSEFKQLRRQVISDKEVSIKSNNLPILNTYKAAITQIFHCLLDNALKYSHEERPPVIEVSVVENEKEWVFSIQDNGIGIASEFYDKIFVMFQRLHNNDQYVGTGIGLAIAKRHVELLQGKIWLESEQGTGSVFHFKIPKTNEYE